MTRASWLRLRWRVRNSCILFCAILLPVIAATTRGAAEITGRVPRILILYPYDERIPATMIAGDAARERLIEATDGKIDLFSEFLDRSRFPESEHTGRMARYLAEKYASHRPDVVIALGEEAIGFIVANRETIAPGAKIVFCGISGANAEAMDLPDDVVGALTVFDITKTLEMARGLQPDARHLVVVAGSAPFDKSWLDTAREDLAAPAEAYETTYLTDLSIDDFVDRAAHLPPDTILLVLTVLGDRTGRNFIPRDALERIAAAAGAPTYGPYSTYIGYGVVGGNTVTFEAMGTSVADLALDALAGKPIADIPVPQTYMADARQLKRWGLSESRLPAGTVLSFQEATLWEEYWGAIIAILAFLALQSLVIATLLVERGRRRRAELQSRRRLLEVIHLSQSATAGALSASIAHELNQPLGAIRSNAEAAETILQGDTPDLGLIQQILADIRDDDQRAAEIIRRLRGLLKKRGEIDWQEFDLNEVVESAVHILHAEAERRSIALVASRAGRELPVKADRVHIQQVILNLAINAMDAMLDTSREQKRVEFRTALADERRVEMSVSDTGRGIPRDQLGSLFDPFYTTKPDGMGLGLSIARAIIETYGGKIWADNRREGGAVLRFVLPLAPH